MFTQARERGHTTVNLQTRRLPMSSQMRVSASYVEHRGRPRFGLFFLLWNDERFAVIFIRMIKK
jgi:hypothetical protein